MDLFEYGTCPPPPFSPSPISPHQASAPLQRNAEDDVSNAGNVAIGPMYKAEGRQIGGRAMQSAITVVVGGGGECGGGCRTAKKPKL